MEPNLEYLNIVWYPFDTYWLVDALAIVISSLDWLRQAPLDTTVWQRNVLMFHVYKNANELCLVIWIISKILCLLIFELLAQNWHKIIMCK
jgi:hypothetical protein